jgi:uncharacterized protein
MSTKTIDALDGFVIITGASSGIGLELTRLAATDGVSLFLVADRDLSAAEAIAREAGAKSIETLVCDLATEDGVKQVVDSVTGREVSALIANAGHGLGGAFFDEDWDKARHVIMTNVTGTCQLVHAIGRQMRARNRGRILVTGSIAGHIPGAFQLVYNSTKAFIDDFCVGLANELKETEVVVTCLQPGVTDTDFFERAGMMNTPVGKDDDKADPAKVAKDGYAAMLKGETQVVSGFMNKVQALFADILPDSVMAQMHRRMAKPES